MAETRSRRRRTWSLWEERRVPTEYEVVTHRFHYHFRREPAPWELSPDWSINEWYRKYREGSPFNVDDWEGYRDPQALTYRRYVELRHEREVYLDNLIDEFEARDHYRSLSSDWVRFLGQYYLPSRFAGHALQMTGAYVGQMAPSSYITNTFYFQTADEMRRIQRTAYLAKALAVDTGQAWLGDSETARDIWEHNPAWQPLRELMERHLVVYDWGEAFAVRNLVVKPVYDALFNTLVSQLARANGDELLALLHDDFDLNDGRYSREVTTALVEYAVGRNPALRDWLQQQVTMWAPLAHRAAKAMTAAFAQAPGAPSADALLTDVSQCYLQFLARLGLAVGTGDGDD